MGGKADIFGVKFDNMTTAQIAALVFEKFGEPPLKPFCIFTPNPEIVMEAQTDMALMGALSAADLVSADGIGIVWASKYFGEKIKERASGYDIVQEVFSLASQSGEVSAFFLGGGADTVAKAAANMEAKYPGLRVAGVRDGYFKPSENEGVISLINEAAPDLLLVGLGSPKQEKWVFENAESLSVNVIMAVGGSFDVMSGNLKRAPEIFRRLGLEWLYRLIRQPKRFKRMLKLPVFAARVLMYNGKNRKANNNGLR